MSGLPEGQRETLGPGAVVYLRQSLRERRKMHQSLAAESPGSGAEWAWHSGATEAFRQIESWLDMMRDSHADWPADYVDPGAGQ